MRFKAIFASLILLSLTGALAACGAGNDNNGGGGGGMGAPASSMDGGA